MIRTLFAALLLGASLTGCDAASLVGPSSGLDGGTGAFEITRTNADPSQATVQAGDAVVLSVETNQPADRFAWSTTGGELSSYVGNPVTWTAPASPGSYVINVIASADAADANASFRFTVR